MAEVTAALVKALRERTGAGMMDCKRALGESGGEIDDLKEADFPGSGRTVEAELTHLISTIGENLVLRRLERLSAGQGGVFSYVHNTLAPGIGKIGVIVALTSTIFSNELALLGKQLAMHIAAASPLYLDIASVPKSALDRERNVLHEQARATGRSEEIIEKMVDGRLRKFYEEVVLLEQIFVVDQKTKISLVVEQAAKTAGAPIRVTGFARFALGEGIDRHRPDFAAEVAAQLKS